MVGLLRSTSPVTFMGRPNSPINRGCILLFIEWCSAKRGEVFVMERHAGPCPPVGFY
jgi:hypothetical protein